MSSAPLVLPENQVYHPIKQATYEKDLSLGFEVVVSGDGFMYGFAGKRHMMRRYNGECGCRVIKSIVGCVAAPFLCLAIPFLSCCESGKECLGSFGIRFCICNVIDKHKTIYRFVIDQEESKKVRNEDFEEKGYGQYDQGGYQSFAKDSEVPMIQSTQYPQHYYKTLYGPKSGFSYILVIPSGNSDGELYCRVVFNKTTGKPMNSYELSEQAEVFCGGWKPGVGRITTVQRRVLQTETTGFGIGIGGHGGVGGGVVVAETYVHKTDIVS